MHSKKVVVISLGGSIVIPDKINFEFLDKFKKALKKYSKSHKFVLVIGGGAIARKYIDALRSEHKPERELSIAGIRATRMNALFVMQFFGKSANESLPLDMHRVKNELAKKDIVICGALRFTERATSDTTAAKLSHFLKTDFINMTNVKGLFSADPRKDKNAKFIPKISWKEFESIALRIKHHAGQHFVLDQDAASIIRENKIKTYIISPSLKNLENVLKGKKFIGTLISE